MDVNNKIKAVITDLLTQDKVGVGDFASRWQEQVWDRYTGALYGDEGEGRPKIVSTEVADTVNDGTAAITDILLSHDELGRYKPRRSGDEMEEQASRATQYAHHVMFVENQGRVIISDWVKSALLYPIAFVKVYWDEQDVRETETYEELDEIMLYNLQEDPEVEIVGIEEFYVDQTGQRIDEEEAELRIAQNEAARLETERDDVLTHEMLSSERVMMRYRVEAVRTEARSHCRIATVPYSDMFFDRTARDIEDAVFIGDRQSITKGELLGRGYDEDVVKSVSYGTDAQGLLDRGVSNSVVRNIYRNQKSLGNADDSLQETNIYEVYVRLDHDDDGVPTLIRAMLAGTGPSTLTLLEWEEWAMPPYASITIERIPDQIEGVSLASRAVPVQNTVTDMLRMTVQSAFLAANPEKNVLETGVYFEDLMTSGPGNINRIRQPGAIETDNVPFVGGQIVGVFEMLRMQNEQTTGIRSSSSSTLPQNNAQNNMSIYEAKARMALDSKKVRFLTLQASESGIKSLFQVILHFICQYQSHEKNVYLGDEWVPINPRNWDKNMAFEPMVGSGDDVEAEDLEGLMWVLGKQEEFLAMGIPLTTIEKYEQTLKRLVAAMGLRNSHGFFGYEAPEMPQPEQEDNVLEGALAEEAKAKAQAEYAKMQIEARKQALAEATEKFAQMVALRKLSQEDFKLDTQRMQVVEGVNGR